MEHLLYGLAMLVLSFCGLGVVGWLSDYKDDWVTGSGVGLATGIGLGIGSILIGLVGIGFVVYANFLTLVGFIGN